MPAEIDLTNIRAARIAIAGSVLTTPLVELTGHRTTAGHRILLKAECLQPTGSFKVRGATYRISRLGPRQRATGVVAYSTGNHAQAVARAAHDAGIAATIVMSPDAAADKVAATRRWGAEVVMAPASSTARRRLAEELAQQTGAALVPPYDDIDVMTGQATIGLEILEQETPEAVFVPVGGGGLLAGAASAIKQIAPEVAVIGVEPEWENDAALSFHSGVLRSLPGPSSSLADAIKVQQLGDLTFPIIRRLVDDVVTVNETEIAAACRLCARDARLIVEPGGVVGVAAALAYAGRRYPTRPVVAVAAGGNIDLARLAALGNHPAAEGVHRG